MIGLWDTTGSAVVRALAAERRNAAGVTSGLALTLIAIVEEAQVRAAEAAATIAAASHPCRILIVMRSDIGDRRARLDAEVVVGGRLGPCEAVVMRMLGRLALHAESVVVPLLAPDVPVVTWWQGGPPARIETDPLGVVADRRITDCARSPNPPGALMARANDYAPGDTDLTWTRITPWRTVLAGVLDECASAPSRVVISAPASDPSASLLRGWLLSRLGVEATIESGGAGQLSGVRLETPTGGTTELTCSDGKALLRVDGHPERRLALCQRPLGEELAEELRRLDADEIYASALAAAAGLAGLDARPPRRVHVWVDPCQSEADPAPTGRGRSDPAAEPQEPTTAG